MGATSFNNDGSNSINNWDVSNVTTMYLMFGSQTGGNAVFNQDIGDWDVGKVQNFRAMFRNSLFNQDLSDWDVVKCYKLGFQMFDRATHFNNGGVSLSCWDTSNVRQILIECFMGP